MGFTFHGIGTIEFGERDYWPDGSFVTTKWFIFGWIPLFPVESLRISYTRTTEHSRYDSSGYYVYKTLPLDRTQVACVYAWFAGLIAPLFVWIQWQEAIEEKLGGSERAAILLLLCLAIVMLMPFYLRRRAKRRM